MSEPDYILELGGRTANGDEPPARRIERSSSFRGRPWLAVHWKCCHVYSRVYRNRTGTAYDGRCPRCGRPVHVGIAADGINVRFFEAR